METFSNLFAITLVSLLAAISPGPDFCIVLRNSLLGSRKIGLSTALGVSSALIIHLAYTLIGIGILIAESPFLYALIKYAGVAYLFYIGLSGWVSSYKKADSNEKKPEVDALQISAQKAFVQGFLTNLLNPKAALFFLSLFSQFVNPETPSILKLEYALINWSITLGWFLFLAIITTGDFLSGKMDRFRLYIDRIMGSALMLLSVKMLFI